MEKYKIIKSIGEGTFGVVYKAIDPNNEVVAIKKIKSKFKTMEDCNVLREIKSLRKFQNPHIIKLRQVILANSELFLVFDYLECNLYQVYTRAKQSNRTLTQNQIKSIFYKIASGLAYTHKCGFFHRDLKPQNILCDNNQIKICDFGAARQIRSRPPFTEYVSTRWYRAPELLLHGTYNSPVDIFALGSIIVQLYMMAPLFNGLTEIETMNKIVEVLGTPTRNQWPEGYKMASTIHYNFPDKKKKELSDLIPNASIQAIDLLQSMLSYSSRKRPSASDILKHEYFQSLHANQQKIVDEKNQTKFSFYENKIIEIPNNLPTEKSVQMQMRKSMIKFGNSFTSSFHLTKEQKIQKKLEKQLKSQLELQFIMEHPKQQMSKKRRSQQPNMDQIAKKFDQMQEILMQLQQKKDKDEKRQKQDKKQKQNYKEPFMESYTKVDSPYKESNKEAHKETDLKMPVFTFGGIGMSSFGNLTSLKNSKTPIMSKMKVGQNK